jgi:hypothetical protein
MIDLEKRHLGSKEELGGTEPRPPAIGEPALNC